MSSTNSARPVSRRGSSLRLVRWPMGWVTGLLLLHESYDASERRLAAPEAEGEAAEPDALIEHLVDHASHVLGVEDAVREELDVHALVVLRPREGLFERHADHRLDLGNQIRPRLAHVGVERVVGSDAVDGQPTDAAVEHPVDEAALRAGVLEEAARQVGLLLLADLVPVLIVEVVIARMDDQDVAALDLDAGLRLPLLEVLGAVDLV